MKNKVGIILLLLLLISCSSFPYAPFSEWESEGYQDTQIDTDKYTISFTSQKSSSSNYVTSKALIRASQIALSNNYGYFEVINKNLSNNSEMESIPIYGGGSTFVSTTQLTTEIEIKLLKEKTEKSYNASIIIKPAIEEGWIDPQTYQTLKPKF